MKNEMGFFLTISFFLFVTLEASKLCCYRVLRRFKRDKQNRQFICKTVLKIKQLIIGFRLAESYLVLFIPQNLRQNLAFRAVW
jgi:hypothetical protein